MKSSINVFGFLILVALLVCSSCVREIVMDAGEKPMVVVECVISNTAPQTLHLRYTKGASKKDYEFVTEADAVLHDLTTGKEAGRFVKAEDGVWTLEYEAEDEHDYRLEVNVPGYETITAEQTMPVRPNVCARRFCHIGGGSLHVKHTHGEGENACYYNVYLNNSTSLWIYAMNYNKETGRRELAEYICGSGVFLDITETDRVYSPKVDTIYWTPPDASHVAPLRCEAGLYLDLRGRKMHRRYLHPLSKNGGTFIISGTFNGFYPVEFHEEDSVHSYTAEKERPLNDGVLTDPADDQGYLVFASLSEEYDKYQTEALRFMELQESSQLSDIYLRENVYTNIHNALGIFGAKAETKMVWSDSPTIESINGVVVE